MASAFGVGRRGFGLAAALGVASVVGLAGPTPAATPSWLRKAFATHLIGRSAAPPVARYEIDSGGAFILDRSSSHPLVKFEDDPEVWSLTVSRGPRGDLIYWNDLRQPLLRITKFGGVTLYTAKRPEGSAASMAGPGAALRLRSVGIEGLTRALFEASSRSTRAAQHLVAYEAPNADPTNDGLIADTATIVSEAIVGLAARPGGRTLVMHISKVYLKAAPEESVAVRDGVLQVNIAPAKGISGRPSSLKVQQALGAHTAAVYVGLTP